ncbi:MAG: hypothetical protein JWQ42_1555, partial [Edaphobacter sp.]|nr:hypothetical protein [Edaphobacter sp.]
MPLGCGDMGTKQLLQELYKLGVKPSFFTLNTTADPARSVDGLNRRFCHDPEVQPVNHS